MTVAHADQRTAVFIAKYLDSKRKNKKYVIEKTVSNTLRVDFVDKALPNGKYIYLYRDGRDCVESVIRQWGRLPELSYLARKFFSTPIHLVLPYILQYGKNLLCLGIKEARPENYIWGVKFRGFENALKTQSVTEICCNQWNECIEAMLASQHVLGERCLVIRYEDFVQRTDQILDEVALFLKLPSNFNAPKIHRDRVGFSKNNIDDHQYKLLSEMLEKNLTALGYQ